MDNDNKDASPKTDVPATQEQAGQDERPVKLPTAAEKLLAEGQQPPHRPKRRLTGSGWFGLVD
ncbi:MAG: hypothetical protein EBV03_07795 [Proteobacteria bacterium]|nr:hypothetical protein [Pseudomonadota bacterium]